MTPDVPRSSRRTMAPRPLREILRPEITRLATGEQAIAYAAWVRAAGAPLKSNARPSAFFNGVLTVECVSSVWANELTYLSTEIINRMSETAPGHPVRRLRFVVERATARVDGQDAGPSEPPAAHRRLSEAALGEAREAARVVASDGLRRAIEAALESSAGKR